MKQDIAAKWFYRSAGILLLITAAAKFVSATGKSGILKTPDPILIISFRYEFLVVGVIEVVVALVCLCAKRLETRAIVLSILATNFLLYRIGLLVVGYTKPCTCLGNLTDALHLPPVAADWASKIILAYLLMGSYATLLFLWKKLHFASFTKKQELPGMP